MPSLLDEDRKTQENTGQHDRLNNLSGDEYRRSNELLASLNEDPRDTLQANEENPEKTEAPEQDNLMQYTPEESGTKQQSAKNPSRIRNFLGRRKVLLSAGLGGTGLIVILLFSSVLQLKLEALISNATKAASAIPGYAVEHKAEYLVTRVLAARMLQVAYGLDDTDIEPVFCPTRGAIGCSLLATYTAKYISDEIGLDIIRMPNGNTVQVSINAKGRQMLGGYARSWEIEFTRDWSNSGVNKAVQKISSHREMRAELKKRVDKKYKNTVTRYVARRILMLQYGVRGWRAFEKTREKIDNKVADVRTQFKAGMYKNTIGKISPRFAAYLACFQGGTDPCDKLLQNLSSDLGTVKKPNPGDDDYDRKLADYEKWEKQKNGISKIQQRITGELADVADTSVFGKAISKIFSSKILAAATGVGAVIGAVEVIDLALSGVDAIDDGAGSLVGFDMNSQSFTGFAFGDGTGLVSNWEKIKVGDFEDGNTSAEVLNELGSLIDCDGSPLCAQENGYPVITATTATVSASSGRWERECPSAGSEAYETILLEEGELVCPTFKLIRDFTESFSSNPLWQSAVAMSKVWMSSGSHTIVGIYQAAVGAVFDAATAPFMAIPGIKEIFSSISGWASEQLQPTIEFVTNTIFNPAVVGYGVPASLNYDGMSGALHTAEWELMRNGIQDGQVLGAGGQYLSEEEAQKVLAYQKSEEAEYFASLPLFDRLFDASLKGSFIQQLALSAPDSGTELALLPSKAIAMLTSSSTASAASSAQTNVSPFGLPLYGYTIDAEAVTADPSIYTEDYCSASADAREKSYKKVDGVPISVYTKSDPCALEKLVVGSLITEANPTDPYAFQPIGATGSTTSTNTDEVAWIIDRKWYDNSATHYGVMKGHQADSYPYYSYEGNEGQTYAIDISPSGINGAPIYALLGGEVTRVNLPSSAASGNGGLEIKTTLPNGKILMHLYAHGYTSLKVGDTVETGGPIGTVGNIGRSSVPHIHMEINYDGRPICGNDIFTELANNRPVNFDTLADRATVRCLGRT